MARITILYAIFVSIFTQVVVWSFLDKVGAIIFSFSEVLLCILAIEILIVRKGVSISTKVRIPLIIYLVPLINVILLYKTENMEFKNDIALASINEVQAITLLSGVLLVFLFFAKSIRWIK